MSRCEAILRGEEVDESTLRALAGPSADAVLEGREGGLEGYWPRVWAMRGLIYAWNETAITAVIDGTTDEHWRVREMSAKVIARHQVSDAFDAIERLRADPVPRVRAAADRARSRLLEFGV